MVSLRFPPELLASCNRGGAMHFLTNKLAQIFLTLEAEYELQDTYHKHVKMKAAL